MDKITQLNGRKAALLRAGEEVRGEIRAISDEQSFVELSAFSFSEGRLYGDEPQGEGVVTGFFTVGGYPFYVVAQNFAKSYGGLTKANCAKIEKTLAAAEKSAAPVVYVLRSQGVRIGEGVEVLEGISALLKKATALKGVVPQFAVIAGEVYGASAAIAAIADVVFFLKEGALATSSPLVLSAKAGKNLKKEEVGGFGALGGAVLPAVEVRDMEEVSAYLKQITELILSPVVDAELNETKPALNERADAGDILALLSDGIELGASCAPELKTVLGRIGGIAVAAAVFDGVRLNACNMKKLAEFAALAARFALPFVTFVDCAGIEESLGVSRSAVLKEIAAYLEALEALDTKIAVVTKKAVGLGYSLFAAKSAGFDYTYALATAEIALFESEKGAEIYYGKEHGKRKSALLARYAEEYSDPVHAAKGGYLDNVIEPQFLLPYLTASLQMLLR